MICPECNEQMSKKDIKNLDKNNGSCIWCNSHAWGNYRDGHLPTGYRDDFTEWCAHLRLDDISIRLQVINETNLLWWNT